MTASASFWIWLYLRYVSASVFYTLLIGHSVPSENLWNNATPIAVSRALHDIPVHCCNGSKCARILLLQSASFS